MKYDLLFKNGTVVSATSMTNCDVAVKDGTVVAVAQQLDPADSLKVVDVAGKYILPGAVDAHTHLDHFGGTVSADSYMTGTRAAACGGVTTVFDYPVQIAGKSLRETCNEIKALCEKDACVDFAFHCVITNTNNGEIYEEMPLAVEEGITSFKCYLVYKKEGLMVDDATLVHLMLRTKELGAMINVHAENPDIIEMLCEKYVSEGKTSAWYHYMSRPEFVAAEADKRVALWAKNFQVPVYVVHMSDKEGLEALIDAKMSGAPVFIETCPHYLEFTCDVFKREDGHKFVCSPPMKGQESQDALWAAIKNNMIDTVATDHCPFNSHEKDWGKDNFTKIPNGCAGVENLYPYMLDAANSGRITFPQAVALCSTNAAKIFGCDKKGAVEVGKDADIVVYDPEKDLTVTVDNMHSGYDHTIWEGKQYHGYPVQTYLRGQLVYDNGEFVGKPGMGQFIKRVAVKR